MGFQSSVDPLNLKYTVSSMHGDAYLEYIYRDVGLLKEVVCNKMPPLEQVIMQQSRYSIIRSEADCYCCRKLIIKLVYL